ncbi:MAG: FimV/HubP family polar landmark protein [Lamprobacter sp.]|uniref:FimV/HubP family polar landmark protein n=1 Tax=Lamprobacter sp. TaxID=3100796 RepID=UPI002B25A39C|nr:FimV/HubP family polar landmark protein [Lamprobacter sp.]MEA3639441.1 FimV/HubP family polar landmark protein [Lamprobacter sp.]
MWLSIAKRQRRQSSLVVFFDQLLRLRLRRLRPVSAHARRLSGQTLRTLPVLAILLYESPASALGLGELRTQSSLNQPFYGEIDLYEVDANALDSVKASLASRSAFEQVGIERPFTLTRLQFTPMIGPRGQPIIQVMTREPIREPYLDLLVEVVWPGGRLVKEYAVLLDPPALGGQPSARAPAPRHPSKTLQSPLAAAAEGSTGIEPASATSLLPSADSSEAEAKPGSRSVPAAASSRATWAEAKGEDLSINVEIPAAVAEIDFPLRYGPVPSGAGLVVIARRLAPPGATLEQTIMALYRNSQDAFFNSDINRLRVGAELVIPTADELFALGPEVARKQYRAALAGRPVVKRPLTDIDARLTIATPETTGVAVADAASDEQGQVDLEGPGLLTELEPEQEPAITSELSFADGTEPSLADASEPPSTQGSAEELADAPDPRSPEATAATRSPSQADGVLKAELLLLREVSEANRQEANELRTRIKSLEAQLDDIRRLLELRNTRLAGLATQGFADEALNQGPVLADADESPSRSAAGSTAGRDTGSDVVEAGPGLDPVGVMNAWRQAMPGWALPLLGVALLLALLALMLQRRRRQASAVDAVDLDDELPGGRAEAHAALPEGLRLDPNWLLAETVCATMAENADQDRGSVSIAAVDQQEASWQGELVELEDLMSGRALAKDKATEQAKMVANERREPELEVALSAPAEQEQEQEQKQKQGPDAIDGLAEAEVFLTYGRYQDAERVLRETIAAVGESPELRYKLAETYVAAGNLAALAPLADRMQSTADPQYDPERWMKIEAALGKEARLSETGLNALDDSVDNAIAGILDDSINEVSANKVSGHEVIKGHDQAIDGHEDDEDLFLDLDELEEKAESSPAQPFRPRSPLDQAAAHRRSQDEAQTRLELDLAALDALTSAESSLAGQLESEPEPEPRPLFSEASEVLGSAEILGPAEAIELPILASLPDDEAVSSGMTPTSDQDLADQASADRSQGALVSGNSAVEHWPIESDEGGDEIGLKLDLARAYLDMEDSDAAGAILQEVVAEGRAEQRRQAEALLAGLR